MKNRHLLLIPLLICALMSACSSPQVKSPAFPPALPKDLALDEGGLPLVRVYDTQTDSVLPMDIETYVCGVVAGEMKNDWPLEALRAQAILARTFVLKFISEKDSRYEGADISTDIAEAQAYNAAAVNDRIREAVFSTAGLVLLQPDGSLPYTWFHAHSGGQTALARESLDWQQPEPAYTLVTDGLDSPDAPASAREWEATFSAQDFLAACRQCGAQVHLLEEIRIKEKGDSGRAVTLEVNGMEVNAARLRIALGSTVMRSTLLTELFTDGETVHMAGRGYGHGVGMPQWGAYALADDGFTGEEIALHYYSGLSLASLWNAANHFPE